MQRKLTAEILAEAIQAAVSDVEMRQRNEALGKVIRAEDGVGNAVECITGYSWEFPKNVDLKTGMGS